MASGKNPGNGESNMRSLADVDLSSLRDAKPSSFKVVIALEVTGQPVVYLNFTSTILDFSNDVTQHFDALDEAQKNQPVQDLDLSPNDYVTGRCYFAIQHPDQKPIELINETIPGKRNAVEERLAEITQEMFRHPGLINALQNRAS
jgi:hypothetical protein